MGYILQEDNSLSVLQAEGNEVAAVILFAQFALLWCFTGGLGTFTLVQLFCMFCDSIENLK